MNLPLPGPAVAPEALLERALAHRLRQRAVRLFPSGYTAALAALSTLPRRQDLVLHDEGCRTSLRDALAHTSAVSGPFAHNDVDDLERRLADSASTPARGEVWVIVQSSYPDLGDFAPLQRLVASRRRHRFRLVVDETHAFGVYGAGGGGLCPETETADRVDLVLGSLATVAPVAAGFAAGRPALLGGLDWCASSYLFGGRPSDADAAEILASLDLLAPETEIARRAIANAVLLRGLLERCGFRVRPAGPRGVSIRLRDDGQLRRLRHLLDQRRLPRDPSPVATHGRDLRLLGTALLDRRRLEGAVSALAAAARDS